jgi:hypothetical protein
LPADAVNGFDAGAMRAEKIPEAEFLGMNLFQRGENDPPVTAAYVEWPKAAIFLTD